MSITYRLDVALTTDPLAATPTWTDLSTYLELQAGITVGRGGRPDEFATPQPGKLSLTLDNSAGAFTAANPASPFYPNVRKNKRIRLTAIVGGVEYPRFDGHVDDWQEVYDGVTSKSMVVVTATSRWRLVARRGNLRSFLAEEVLLDSPLTYLPFSDASTATTAENIAANPYGNAAVKNVGGGGTYTFGSGTGPPADGSSALVLTPASSTSGYYFEVQQPYYTLSTPYGLTLEAWINSTQAITVFVNVLSGAKASVLNLTIDGTKHLQAFADFGSLTATSATVAANGATRHCVVTVAADGTNHVMRLYLDGTQVATSTTANTSLGFGCDRIRIGGDGTSFEYTGTISHVAFYPSAISATRVQAHYNAGWTGFGGERSDQRIARLAAYVGLTSTVAANTTGVAVFDDATLGLFDSAIFAAADVSLLEQGSATVYGQATGGQDAVTAINDVAATEFGVAFISRDGLLTFQSRSHRYNRAATLALAAADLESTLTWSWDDSHLVNLFTATTQDGVSQTARNQASITTETGTPVTDSAQLLTRDALDAYSNASWRVNQYGYPIPRASQIAVELGTLDDGTAAQVLASDVGDALIVTGLSSTWAPAGYTTFFAEDYTEQINVGSHVVTWTTSNAAISRVAVFDDAILGIFDSAVFAF